MNLRVTNRSVLGGVVVVLGVLLLLGTTGMFETESLVQFVPSLFVLVGVYAIVRSGFRNLTGPVLLVLVAGTVQLLVLDVVTDAFAETYWPVLVVVAGLTILLSRSRRSDPTVLKEDLDLVAVFGGVERRPVGERFRSADLAVAFGGAELDLRDATSAKPSEVDALVVFGGAEVYVPEDWVVEVDALPLFGAVTDERPRAPLARDGETPDLVVTGAVAFGGISIK
ncbi:cell wall-active antibiotics response protein [Halorubellus salinus]|uniref:cell wall-active antibiotics response protein n=1 Tax=Halorubellus salinus TaxID=755309 RepID=UPI001D05CEE1|nr:cell wall-active antibiotics response protein [Halorubellus salinus]